MTEFSAIGAAGVVMDIHTGEVLAMTSLRSQPERAGQGLAEARFNRATLGVYELGSTFKPFTVAMAMDAGIIKSFGQMYPCPTRFALRHVDPRHASLRPRLLGRRDHEGKLEHRHGADCRRSWVASAEGIPQQDGLSSIQVEIELKERGRTLTRDRELGTASRP
jgi:cell division protein FtsI (penicillin-binding protein 3)